MGMGMRMRMRRATFAACLAAGITTMAGSAHADEAPPPEPRRLSEQPKPLTSIGGARWEPSLGLVAAQNQKEKDGKAAPEADAPAQAVPAIPASSLTELGFRAFGGLDKRAGADGISPAFGLALRYEARRVDSLFAPWAEAGFSGTIYELDPNATDSDTGAVWDMWLRGGLDVHPIREHWIGIGPFIGYRQLHTRALERSAILQGADLGGQIHIRTSEAAGVRPTADAILYGFVQSAGLADMSNRSFVGMIASAGGDFRFFTQIEGCASSPDSCFPRQLRAVAGLGGAW